MIQVLWSGDVKGLKGNTVVCCNISTPHPNPQMTSTALLCRGKCVWGDGFGAQAPQGKWAERSWGKMMVWCKSRYFINNTGKQTTIYMILRNFNALLSFRQKHRQSRGKSQKQRQKLNKGCNTKQDWDTNASGTSCHVKFWFWSKWTLISLLIALYFAWSGPSLLSLFSSHLVAVKLYKLPRRGVLDLHKRIAIVMMCSYWTYLLTSFSIFTYYLRITIGLEWIIPLFHYRSHLDVWFWLWRFLPYEVSGSFSLLLSLCLVQ